MVNSDEKKERKEMEGRVRGIGRKESERGKASRRKGMNGKEK